MKVLNGTQHEISIYKEEDTMSIQNGRKLVLKTGAVPLFVLPEGTNLNAQEMKGEPPEGDFGFPVFGALKFVSADQIPDADLVIVSAKFKAACAALGRDISTLGTIHGTIYETEDAIRPCGCLGISVG